MLYQTDICLSHVIHFFNVWVQIPCMTVAQQLVHAVMAMGQQTVHAVMGMGRQAVEEQPSKQEVWLYLGP